MTKYKSNPYNSASYLTSYQQVILIYNKIISYITKSKEFIINKQPAQRFQYLKDAQILVENVSRTINYEQGGELSEVMHKFYAFLYYSIAELQYTKDIEEYNKVIKTIEIITEEWKNIPQL